MFTGPYSFFDYKYAIPGYSGQDYDNGGRLLFLLISLGLIVLFVITFLIYKRCNRDKKINIDLFLGIFGIFMIVLYLTKTIWESYYDLMPEYDGAFNKGILPLDTCSVIMVALPLAGFARGKVQYAAKSWLATGGMVGGISNMLFLRALNYYPFWTFGAIYSMFWHLSMVLIALLVMMNNEIAFDFKTIGFGFIFQSLFALPVIVFDYVDDWDFMLYREAGGIPLIEDLASDLNKTNFFWVTPIMVSAVYYAAFALIIGVGSGIHQIGIAINKKQKIETIH